MIFTPIFSLSHFSPLRDIENQKITVFDSGFNFGKKRRKDILSAHPIIGSNEFINIFMYKSNDYLKKSPVYGHFRKTAA